MEKRRDEKYKWRKEEMRRTMMSKGKDELEKWN